MPALDAVLATLSEENFTQQLLNATALPFLDPSADFSASELGDLALGEMAFMVKPISEWTFYQAMLFPWLFIIPAEILGFTSYALILLRGGPESDLPHGPRTNQPLEFKWDWIYITFNRLVLLPIISFMIVRVVWNSSAVIWEPEKVSFWNGIGMFVVVFSLSDLTYYIGHRVVHRYKFLFRIIHSHHHKHSEPIRGWADTCNAHPLDFFYTGFCTSPMSVLWLMPEKSVHIYAIAACLYVNSFLGSLGHSRLDLDWGVFNSRFHAGHHAYSHCNYAQNVEIWDRLFGSFRDYSETVERKRKAQ
jgi:sterol desaturase/sphingolipid hydroxylase (fatty acid hydroxylase superfamily)